MSLLALPSKTSRTAAPTGIAQTKRAGAPRPAPPQLSEEAGAAPARGPGPAVAAEWTPCRREGVD